MNTKSTSDSSDSSYKFTDGDWSRNSKLVLSQLESLNDGVDDIKDQVSGVKEAVMKLQSRLDSIDDLKLWKKNFDEVASIPHVKNLIKDVDDLKSFKIKAVTIFAVVQFTIVTLGVFSKFLT